MKRYGISTWIANSLYTNEAVDRLSASGFREVEISGSGSGLLEEWENDPADVCQKLESVDIRVLSIHSPVAGRRLDDADKAVRQASIGRARGDTHVRRVPAQGHVRCGIH